MTVHPNFARIVTAPDGRQLLIFLFLTESGTWLHHTMLCGQIQLDFKIGPLPYQTAHDMLFKSLDEQKMVDQILADPVKTFNDMTKNGTTNTPWGDIDDMPTPSLN